MAAVKTCVYAVCLRVFLQALSEAKNIFSRFAAQHKSVFHLNLSSGTWKLDKDISNKMPGFILPRGYVVERTTRLSYEDHQSLKNISAKHLLAS